MKTKDEVLDAVKAKTTWDRSSCEMIDGRDYYRLANFFPVDQWELFGLSLKEGSTPSEPEEWTRENILKHLESDLDFAFEKAINHRGISSSLMHNVILMWMWVLDDELCGYTRYNPYGTPLYEKIADKYGLPNRGDEYSDEE